jgi:hypothetical protein
MNKQRQEAYELIELGEKLGPEDEGIDLTDKEYTFEQMAGLRGRLSRMRKAIDLVNKGLAAAWHKKDPKGYFEDEHEKHWLGITKKVAWMDEDTPLAFAKWLKKQDAKTIALILPSQPPYGLRMTPIPEAARDTFFVKLSGAEQASIQSKPL